MTVEGERVPARVVRHHLARRLRWWQWRIQVRWWLWRDRNEPGAEGGFCVPLSEHYEIEITKGDP